MNLLFRFLLLFWIALSGFPAAVVAPIADCKPCGISLDIPQDGLWQGLQKGNLTTFAMQRDNELFATIEIMKFYNEARYALDQLAEHYLEIFNMDFVIDEPFVSRKINGIPVRWGRGRGQSEDGSKFLIHLVFFMNDEDACWLTAFSRERSEDLHKYLLPAIIESMRRLPVKLAE